jgi:hypothetical protein
VRFRTDVHWHVCNDVNTSTAIPPLHRSLAGFLERKRFGLPAVSNTCDLVNPLVIAFVAFVANYLECRHFGLYEDDYIWVMTLNPMTWKFGDLLSALSGIWIHWIRYYQGRPLGFTIGAVLAFAGGKMPSLAWSYFTGWCIWSLNGFLIYCVARRRLSPLASLTVGLCFVTFCPDVSKVILMHRMIHISTTLVLLALLLYQRERKFLSYVFVACALLTYESTVFAFFLAPLLEEQESRPISLLRRALRHAVICSLIAGTVLVVRSLCGDVGRAGLITSGDLSLIPKIIEACLLGLWTTLHVSLWDGPLIGLSGLDWSRCMTAVLVIPLFFMATRRSRIDTPPPPASSSGSSMPWDCIACLAVIAFSYCLDFRTEYFPPTYFMGRLSAVHVPAAIPWCLVVGACVEWATHHLGNLRRAVAPVLGLYLFLVVQYGLFVQEEQYVKGWEQQKSFWFEMVRVSGSLHDGDCIVVDVDGVPWTYGFNAEASIGSKFFTALKRFVKFPGDWHQIPRVFGYSRLTQSDWNAGRLRLHAPSYLGPEAWPVLDKNFYFFRYREYFLTPVDGPVEILGHRLTAKKLDISAPPRKTTSLFRKIFSGI